MEELKQRVKSVAATLPPGQRVVAVVAVAVLVATGVMFFSWLGKPSYTLLYGNLDDKSLASVIGELDAQGVPYEIGAGGSQVLVPRAQVYEVRAALAESGVRGEDLPQGYEILEGQGFAVSDFRQRVDFQRALEGELSKTLMAMDGIEGASVRLAMPEEAVFEDEQQPVTASVLLNSPRPLAPEQVEGVVFLVSSAVEGLDTKNVTVADSAGRVLSAPGDDAMGSIGDRNLRQTRAYEAAIAGDIQRLLSGAGGTHLPSVVVRAQLNFDETSTETETFDPESKVVLREESSNETLGGDGAAAQGVVGVEGGMLPGTAGGAVEYANKNAAREYGVNREVTRTTVAPGQIEKMSVAIMMDDGSESGVETPSEEEVEALVSAAVGLDEERGDTVEVSTLPFAAADEAEDEAAGMLGKAGEIAPQAVGALILLLVAFSLFRMTRGRTKTTELDLAALGLGPVGSLEGGASVTRALEPGQVGDDASSARREVVDMVQKQPEEIAQLLRGWLADRRSVPR